MISRLHYLTQDVHNISHQELAEIACKNGIRWIQLRVKNQSYDGWLQIAKDVKSICDQFQTTLIINDNVEICKAINADGVHLGKNDLSIIKTRKILGITEHEKNGANYIGLGPYKFTKTKSNLSAVLGLDGYSTILLHYNSSIPIIAIGGIQLKDVKPLINTGIYGIAVSSAINLSNEKEKTIKEFIQLV